MFSNFHVTSCLYEFMADSFSQLLIITLSILVAIDQVHVKI